MKGFQRLIMGLTVALSLFSGCVEPVEIEITEETRLLVVDGIITDAPGPYQVKLSVSGPLNQNLYIPETGASLMIEAESGEKTPLNEVMEGVYVTDSSALRGQTGQNYRLLITRNNGNVYQSSWETIRPSPAIDSVYFRIEAQNRGNGLENGVQVYVDTHDPTGNSRFYRWTWSETWKYSVPHSTPFEYIGNMSTRYIEEKRVCFMNDNSRLIRIGTSTGNSSDIIAGERLDFITTETNRLQMRYSMNVSQYVLSEQEYLFWKSIQEATENTGTLFDRQPQSTTGNVKNTNDPNESVLGYFSASGVSEKRAYFQGSDFQYDITSDVKFRQECNADLDTILLGPFADQQVFRAIDEGGVFFNFYQPFIFVAGFLITSPECSDCTVQGGTTQVPDFWEE
ncbi:MAG: DUF4249 domain-containing protein [Bacteroidia bacterium]|nr:DUF4249 domain-containing protein [Bacteroidia bacterium]